MEWRKAPSHAQNSMRWRLGDESPVCPVLRQNLVTIDVVDFLQSSATLYWYEGITILAVLLLQSLTQRSMQFDS
jgi:hypothetical protein